LIRQGGAEGAITVGRVLMLGLLGSMEAVNDDGVPYVLEGRRLGRVDLFIHDRALLLDMHSTFNVAICTRCGVLFA
jgi:hypothetical protein